MFASLVMMLVLFVLTVIMVEVDTKNCKLNDCHMSVM